jgi:hypothetical protein
MRAGFTADGQIDQRLVTDRDRRHGVDSTQKKKARADIPASAIDPGADAGAKERSFKSKIQLALRISTESSG